MLEAKRVVLSKEAYNALRAESLVRNKNIKTTLEEMVFGNLSHEGQKILNIIRDERAQIQEYIDGDPPLMPPDSKRPRGTFSDAEIDQIKALHREGLTPGKIGKRMGRNKSSVAYAVDAMRKRGEL